MDLVTFITIKSYFFYWFQVRWLTSFIRNRTFIYRLLIKCTIWISYMAWFNWSSSWEYWAVSNNFKRSFRQANIVHSFWYHLYHWLWVPLVVWSLYFCFVIIISYDNFNVSNAIMFSVYNWKGIFRKGI